MIASLLILTLLVLIFVAVNSANQATNSKKILLLLKEVTDSTVLEPPDKLNLEIVDMGKDDALEDEDDLSAKIVDSRSIWEEDSLTAEEIENG